MDKLIAYKQARNDEAALALVRTNRGKLLMDEITLFTNGIVIAADTRVAAVVEEQTENAMLLRLVSIIGSAVILFAAAPGIFTIIRYTRELKLARDELAMVNDKLETRVAARTQELAIANSEMRDARDRAQTLLAEVNHRVANSLSLVVSLIGLQSRTLGNPTAKVALDEARARVQSIAMVHRRLYDDGNVLEVALDEYLASLLDQFRATIEAAEGIKLRYELVPLRLRTDASINLGIVVTEWVMNAFKYAYPDRSGEVRVVLTSSGNGYGILSVEDDGVGRNGQAKPQGTGVGTRIVSAMAASMGATIEYVATTPGTLARFTFPVAAI